MLENTHKPDHQRKTGRFVKYGNNREVKGSKVLQETGNSKARNKYSIRNTENTENSVQTVKIVQIILDTLTIVVWFGMLFFLLGALT